MYCNNCGKQLSDGSKFCSFCGKMADGNVKPSQDYSSEPDYKAEVVNDGKRLWPKSAAYAIGAVALAVTIILGGVLIVSNYLENKVQGSSHQRIDGYFTDRNEHGYGKYDDDEPMPWDYFDDDDIYGGYGMYGGMPYSGGQNGSQSNPSVSPQPKPTAGPWWPADENGKYPTDEGYKWPSGDGKYEYYANSTIPKFESVTGKALKKTDAEDDNTYYTYDLDENAYNKYIEALKEKGFKQSDFEVKGQNSYEVYTLGEDSFYEYLIIYHMNSDNELIIMA